MDCERVRMLFSELYENTLARKLADAAKAHFASCGSCRFEFGQFVRATSDLRATKPGTASKAYVAAVLERVERAADEDALAKALDVARAPHRRWRAVASHIAVAAVSAAAAVAVYAQLRAPEVRTVEVARIVKVPVPAPAAPAVAIPNRPIDSDAVVQAPAAAPPVTTVAVHWIDVPPLVEVDRALVADTVKTVKSGFQGSMASIEAQFVDPLGRLGMAWKMAQQELEKRSASAPTPVAAAPIAAAPVVVPPPANAGAPGVPVADEPAGSRVIRSADDHLSLELSGSRVEVIQSLLALLDSDDSEVVDLAAAQLDELRRELETHPGVAGKLKPLFPTSGTPREERNELMRLFVSERADAPAPPKPAEAWNAWWRDNAIVLLALESTGT